MLEIILVWLLAKQIAKMAKEKGRSGTPFVILFVVLWFVGEAAGIIIGIAASEGGGMRARQPDFCFPYICALIGAGLGTGISFAVVGSLSARERPRGYGRYDDSYRRRRPYDDRGYDEHDEWGRDKYGGRRRDESKAPGPSDHIQENIQGGGEYISCPGCGRRCLHWIENCPECKTRLGA